VTLLRAEKSPDSRDGWRPHAADLDDVVLDGDHYTIWSPSRLDRMVAALRDRLDRTGQPAGTEPAGTEPAG
jgi:thioesterase domain-containing protein